MADNFYASYPVEGSGGVTSINGETGDVTIVGGTGITVTETGPQEITIASTSAGDVTLTAFGSTPNSAGASLTGQALTLQPASGSFPGGVSTTTQSFAGNKTFTGTIAASNFSGSSSGTNTGDVTIGTANGLSLVGQALSLALSSTSTTGALSNTDWNTFNNKQAAGNYITALTGDGTATGPGSVALTLATVNGNVGSFTVSSITVNAKGLITAASSGTTGNLTAAGTDGIAITGGTGSVLGSGTSIAQQVADATHNGYLSSTDWNTFNGRQSTISFATIGLVPTAAGATISGGTITLQPANGTFGGVVSNSSQTFAGQKTFNDPITAFNFSGSSSGVNTGDLTNANFGASPNTRGYTLAGAPATLTLQPADGTNPGGVSTTTQTFAGVKTFSSAPNLSSLTASLPLQLDASKNIVSTAIDLSTAQATGVAPIARGGTNNGSLAVTNGGLTYTDGSKLVNTGAGSAGQLLKSAGAGAPVWANNAKLTEGFDAYNTASRTVTAGTPLEVIFDVPVFDISGGYSASNGRYTAAATGYYQFEATLSITMGITPPTSLAIYLLKNGTGQMLGRFSRADFTTLLAYSFTITKLISLTASDYVSVWVSSVAQDVTVGGTGGTTENSSFSGFIAGV